MQKMKKLCLIIALTSILLKASAMDIELTINGKTFTAEIEDTETGHAFYDLLPMTLDMSELNGNEKYHYLLSGLPTDAHYYSTINAGDLMLFGNSCVVLFYGNAGGYSYSRLGKLSAIAGLSETVGTGSVSVTFSQSSTSFTQLVGEENPSQKIYNLQGNLISGEPQKGVFIKNGKKIIK